MVSLRLMHKGIKLDKIDLDSLRVAEDESLNIIAIKAETRIREMELDYDNAEELRALVLKKAYDNIYGG